MSKPFDEAAIAKDAIVNAPGVTIDATRLKASQAPEPVQPAATMTDVTGLDENDGKAVAHSLNAAHSEFIGEDLSPALVQAVETVAAGVFSSLRILGMPPVVRIGLLAFAIAPALAVVGLRFRQKMKEGPARG